MRQLNRYKKKNIEGENSYWSTSFWSVYAREFPNFLLHLKRSSLHVFISNLQKRPYAKPVPLAYGTKLQSLLRGKLNRYRNIFDINPLRNSVPCITRLIVLTKTLPFSYLTSRHCHSNTANVFCINKQLHINTSSCNSAQYSFQNRAYQKNFFLKAINIYKATKVRNACRLNEN